MYMRSLWKSVAQRCLVAFHFMLMVGVFLTCWIQYYKIPAEQGQFFVHDRTICAAYILILFALSRIYNCYKTGLFQVGELFYSQVMANLISWGITYVLVCIMAQRIINPLAGFVAFGIQCVLSVLMIILMNRMYFQMHKPKKTLVLYRNESDLQKLAEIRNFARRWDVQQTVHCDAGSLHDLPAQETKTAAKIKDIHRLIEIMKDYDTVFVSGVNATLRNGIVKYCVETNKDCYFVPHTGDIITSGAIHMRSFSVPIFRARRCKPSPEFLFLKRAFDVCASLAALAVFSIPMLITAIIVKSYDGGPAFYKQVRLTKDGKEFEILKFRSMRMDAEKDGVARLSSGDKDDRITPVGKVIRAIRFDELPQLINILKGDMSVVGPRPERPEIAAQYAEILPAFHLRLQVKAGLTGYAQVYGRYNTEPQDKLKMDLMYINNIGILEDVKLILATVRILFMKESTEGIAEGQTTAMGATEEREAERV